MRRTELAGKSAVRFAKARRPRAHLLLPALIAFFALLIPAAAWADPPSGVDVGDDVYVGAGVGYGGTSVHGIYVTPPADPLNPGPPDLFAYCVEHNISVETDRLGHVGDFSDYLGANFFVDPVVQGKVLWVLANSYPAMSLVDFGIAAGAPGISLNDAIEATQYAIWRYTELTFDASWAWSTPDSETAYWYLINGANASAGLQPADLHPTVSVAPPTGAQVAGTLVGPFLVNTDQPTVTVTADPVVPLVDSTGTAIDPAAVVDGQELYLDLRGVTTAGSSTVAASAVGSSSTGMILSVPNVPGGPTTALDHAQTLILVTPSTTQTSGAATISWAAVPAAAVPAISTTLVDLADGDHTLPSTGGTVTDTVAYVDLTPGTSYTVSGELMRKSNGSSTGITGSTTFTATTATGSIDVTFTVPAGFAGQSLVAFESLFEAGNATAVAQHQDINDAAQTIAIQSLAPNGPANPSVSQPQTAHLASTGSTPPYGAAALAILAIALGAAPHLARRVPKTPPR